MFVCQTWMETDQNSKVRNRNKVLLSCVWSTGAHAGLNSALLQCTRPKGVARLDVCARVVCPSDETNDGDPGVDDGGGGS
jgi:hypothetical protein